MMKRKIGLFMLSVLLLAPFALFSAAKAYAQSSFTSNASITFVPGEGTPPVLDPTDPTQPFEPGVEPGDPSDDPTNDAGPLTLDYVSSLDFGSHSIESEATIYESTVLRPFIQVTDRRGTGDGWHVTAQLSAFANETETTLPGAVLTLKNGSVISTTTGGEPTANDPVALYAGGAAEIVVNAQENEGLGTWITRWFPVNPSVPNVNDSVTLEIPAGAATVGDHQATITWTLHDAPGL